MWFSDGHCHFDFPVFDADRDALIHQARERNIHRLVVPGVTVRQCRRLPDFARQCAGRGMTVRFAVGLHPCFLPGHDAGGIDELESLLRAGNGCCAVGEAGLHGPGGRFDRQVALLEDQLALARQYNLPVILHQVHSHNAMIRALKRQPPVGGLLHAFSGSPQMAGEYLRLGLKLGIGGTVTFRRAQKTRAAVAAMPLSALVLETDSPDMPLAGFQGARNSPLQIPAVFRSVCGLRPEASASQLARQVETNVSELFGAR